MGLCNVSPFIGIHGGSLARVSGLKGGGTQRERMGEGLQRDAWGEGLHRGMHRGGAIPRATQKRDCRREPVLTGSQS